jgi:SNF2 family DNA or RNA helicase
MLVKKRENKIQITFAYDPALVALVKALPGRVFHQPTKSWFIPLINSFESLQELKKNGFTVEDELFSQVAVAEEASRIASELTLKTDTDFESSLPLYNYQRVGAAFLTAIGSGLLGDECGLGKTLQAIAVCEKVQTKRVLIFCPASVKWQWKGEIDKFSGRTVQVIEGTKAARDKQWKRYYAYTIANYELLIRDFDVMNEYEWDVIVADEATKISNPRAKQSKLIKKLRARRRIAMTGTPISNRADEIWNILDFINPGSMGGFYTFLDRYCVKNRWGAVYAYQNITELNNKIKRYMIRRLKMEVLPELPAKISTDLPFKFSPEEKKLYDQLRKEILFEIEAKDIDKIENPMSIQYTLVKMTRLRQLADSMELLGHNVKSSKLEVLKEKLEEVLAEPGRKAIIFTQFSQMADILERELAEYRPLKISGTIKEEYRDVVEKFNTDEGCRILIMTSAGQFGLNIQRASVIFHYDQEWSLAKMQQRDGRADRIGQKEVVMVYNLLAKGSMDYYVKKVLHGKADLSDRLLGDTPVSMETIKEILNYEE